MISEEFQSGFRAHKGSNDLLMEAHKHVPVLVLLDLNELFYCCVVLLLIYVDYVLLFCCLNFMFSSVVSIVFLLCFCSFRFVFLNCFSLVFLLCYFTVFSY